MSLASLIQKFQSQSIQDNGVLNGAGLTRLQSLIQGGQLGELRVFVAASAGLGHQASSINILKRLISFGVPTTQTVRVIYEVSTTDDNLPKLEVLLPGFSATNPGAPYSLNGVPLVFTAYKPGTSLTLPLAGLAVCGGSETKANLTGANDFNVDLYLQLQPFQWTMQKNMLWVQGQTDPIVLSDVDVLGGTGFINRAFYMPQPVVTDAEWDTLFETFPKQLQLHTAEMIDGYMQPDTDKKINFLPVYGIGDLSGSIPTLPGSASSILFYITTAVAQAQMQGSAQTGRPTVIGVMSSIRQASWNNLKLAVQGKLTDGDSEDDDNSFARAMAWATANNLPTRVTVQDTIDPKAFDTAVMAMKDGDILVVSIPDLPPDIFNLLYSEATFPFVFEGKGTANLALNLGLPYIHMAKGGVVVYPTTFLGGGVFVSSMADELTRLAAITQEWLGLWPATTTQTPAYKLGMFMVYSVSSPGSPYEQYFQRMQAFYHAEQNDKLLMGLLWSLPKLPVWQTKSMSLVVAKAADSPLQTFYNTLVANVSNGVLNLIPASLNKGVIFDFLTGVMGSSSLSIGSGSTAVTISFPSPYDKITVTGPTVSFGSGTLDANVVFTLAEDNTSLTSVFTLIGKSFSFDGAPWFAVNDTTIVVTVSNAGQRIQGQVDGTFKLGSKTVTVSFSYPAGENELEFEGSFGDDPPTFNDVFQLLGGINFLPTLPSPLNNINSLALEGVQLSYDYATSSVSGLNVNLITTADWPIFGKVALEKGATLKIAVASPTGTRQVSWNAAGSIQISDGTIDLGITYPDLSMTAQMAEDSKPIPLGDFLTFFLPPSVTLDLKADVVALNMSVKPGATPVYSVAGTLDTDWPISVLGKTMFTLTSISMNVDGTGTSATGTISAQTTIFPDDPTITFAMAVTAGYLGKGAWNFSGELTDGSIKVTQILKAYLPDGWIPAQAPDIDITVFKAQIATSGASGTKNSYEVGGTVKIWNVPFASEISFQSTISGKFGYLAESTTAKGMGVPKVPASPAMFPILASNGQPVLAKAVPGGESKAGYYGQVLALIDWANVELILGYNFEPGIQQYQITWGIFTGTLTQKDVGGQPHWIADISFTEGTTLGGMIETVVSWATGSRFGLGSPWNILDSISLSNFSLVFDITARTVAFQIKIGPIEMGFARLNGITVQYNNDKTDQSKNGVQVTIDGSFLWQSDTGQPISWDATKPENTPAPPGNGNKYLDLRLLAMGQHVTASCFPTSTTVQKAIECMATLPEPSSGQLPPITFDPSSNWLIGTDFGLLKIQDGGDEDGGYVVTLQVVFNDPNLYGLRLALAGNAAKIFKGLDFQIMYRKISDSLGVYQAEIALPSIMRKIQTGAFTITLPVFGIQVYTNGDFQVDIGFPWNEDFSRSFTVEAIVPPGIPLLGSGGFYFGKLSSASTNKVPAATNGTFNPVIVFGFGAQLGLGKSIDVGILSAGFSLTVFGIIEGVLAKWNPYVGTEVGTSSRDQIQGQYYFSLSGTMGLIGLIYGSVDFAVIKADVRIEVKIYAQIVFASYQDIPLSVVASVDVTAKVTINLGLFKIHLSFSFSARIKETFVITTSHDAPWQVESTSAKGMPPRLARPLSSRLNYYAMRSKALPGAAVAPNWALLAKPATPASLGGYCAAALTMAGDAATQLSQQVPCYVLSMFIESVKSADQDSTSSAAKAAGAAADSPFETLCKLVAKWAVASIQSQAVTPDQVSQLIVTETQLQDLLSYLADTTANPTPLPRSAIDSFLGNQVAFGLQAPTAAGEADVAFFPMPVSLQLDIPKYGSWSGYKYVFTDYNTISDSFLAYLREYFNQLAVQVQDESGQTQAKTLTIDPNDTSVADFVYSDYFLLLMRQMVQYMSDGLRDYKYPIQAGQSGNDVVTWTNNTGQLSGPDAFSLYDLFVGNGTHVLTAGKVLTIQGVTYAIQPGDTFTSIAAQSGFGGAFDATTLATLNQAAAGILQGNKTISYKGAPIVVSGADSLALIAGNNQTTVADLLANSDVLTQVGLLAPLAPLAVPPYPYAVQSDDTLTSIVGKFGITMLELTDQSQGVDNGTVTDLFAVGSDAYIDLAHLPQFQVEALLQEAQRVLGLQHLSGMVSRYYFSGLRLPTSGITPNAMGMWVSNSGGTLTLPPTAGLFALTGQQFPLPDISGTTNFVINLNGFKNLSWMSAPGGGDSHTITVAPDSSDNKAIQAVKSYATANRLALSATGLGAGSQVSGAPASYPLSSPILWQSTAGIALPYGAPAEPPKSVNLWPLPVAMASLPDPVSRAVDPRFALSVERYDQASGATSSAPITDYGWSSAVAFTVKKLPDQRDSNPSDPSSLTTPDNATTYEIVGAGGQDVVVLERLLDALGGQDSAIYGLTVGYASPDVGGTKGLQTDAATSLTLGISQVNLSTVTRPPTSAKGMDATDGSSGPALLNTSMEFVRLLWEASITRAGGFYLYYFESTSGAGLPDRVFNDKGEAVLTLILLHAKPGDVNLQNRVANYINAVVIGTGVDLSDASIVATADGVAHTVPISADSTLGGLAYRYFANVADVAVAASGLTLVTGAKLAVNNGVYMVSPLGTAPGGGVSAIASHFGVTVDALKAANPAIASWPTTLPAYSALRLPSITVTVGTSAGGSTLASIVAYYGVTLTGLAADNQAVTGLLPVGQSVVIVGGPTVLSSTVTPGVQSIAAHRPLPVDVPSDPTAPNYAVDLLTNSFSLLGYKVAANQDFTVSNMGIPAGPQAPTNGGSDKIQAPRAMADGGTWDYAFSVPYTSLCKASGGTTGVALSAADSPYRGNGTLLQMDFSWQDLYGNTIITTLSNPQAGDSGPLNETPTLIGYTDSLVGLSRWPSVSSGWMVKPGTGGAKPTIGVSLTFSPTAYLSPEEDPDGSESWQQNALQALPTVQTMVYQLTDPNGIALALETTLLAASLPLSASLSNGLVAWIQTIFSFIQDRSQGGKSVPIPSTSPTTPVEVAIDPDQVTVDQIFLLSLSFVIERTSGVFEGDCGTLDGVRRVASSVDPMADGDGSGSLTAFAAGFREALSKSSVYTLNVATGVDRTQPSAAESSAAVWAVRLGATSGQAIGYSVRNAGAPIVFAPRPVANTLTSRNGVPIYDYVSGTGINFTTPSRTLDFTSIDLDVWTGQLFSAIDGVLTPTFTSSMLLVDNRTQDPAPGGKGYLGQLLGYKEALAGIACQLMIPVYKDQTGVTVDQLAAAQESFRQELLVALGNAYTVHAAIEFLADVTASVTEGPEATQPPNLYGSVTGTASSTVTFTSSKLTLSTTAQATPAPLVFLVTAPGVIKDDSGAVLEVLSVANGSYNGAAIEHQIGSVPGIQGYVASSWLSFVENTAAAGLTGDLGAFDVPLVLRSFPATPAMTDQAGVQSHPETTDLSTILEWTYDFTYSLDYHYPQDRVYAQVEFNIADTMAKADFRDAFNALAEFVTVYPSVQVDLIGMLAKVSGTTTDPKAIADATVAIKSFNQLVGNVVSQAQSSGLKVMPKFKGFMGTAVAAYSFFIEEDTQTIKEDEALVVTVNGAPPAGVGDPSVVIDGYTTQVLSATGGVYSFYFTDSDGNPLQASVGQAIGGRSVVLPEMQVLERQDAWSTVYLKRNEELGGKAIADPFVYTTPDVQFAAPCHPVVRSSQPVNIATLGSQGGQPVARSLSEQLTALFTALFNNYEGSDVIIQMEVEYGYSVNAGLSLVPLPVLMQPPTTVSVNGGAGAGAPPIDTMIANLAGAIQLWFEKHQPQSTSGLLIFGLTIMSNLTTQPMPLVDLDNLQLAIQYVSPPLATR